MVVGLNAWAGGAVGSDWSHYGLGALANIQDAFAGIKGGIAKVKARKEIAGHSWIEGEDINISILRQVFMKLEKKISSF